MFTPLNYDDGQIVEVPLANAQTVTKGMALMPENGYLTDNATTTTEEVLYVALEDKVSTADGQTVRAVPVFTGIRFLADCDDVVSIADRFTHCDLATASTLNPDASTEDLFYIEEIVGEAEVSKQVIGYFSMLLRP